MIISPGIGKQGGDIQTCRKMDMDFAIIGGSINQSDNPAKYVSELNQILVET